MKQNELDVVRLRAQRLERTVASIERLDKATAAIIAKDTEALHIGLTATGVSTMIGTSGSNEKLTSHVQANDVPCLVSEIRRVVLDEIAKARANLVDQIK